MGVPKHWGPCRPRAWCGEKAAPTGRGAVRAVRALKAAGAAGAAGALRALGALGAA